jgi:hypothetical protein
VGFITKPLGQIWSSNKFYFRARQNSVMEVTIKRLDTNCIFTGAPTGRASGAGDRDRTGDIQLGKLQLTFRPTQNQAHRAGHLGPSAALSARIEHDSEHNFHARTILVLQHPQPRRTKIMRPKEKP